MNLDALAEKLWRTLELKQSQKDRETIRAALAQARNDALSDDALVREIAMQLKPYQPINEDNARELMNDIRDGIRLYAERVARADPPKEPR